MAWYDEAVFYHIYPLGLTGAPLQNDYGKPEHRLKTLLPWIGHMKKLGVTGLYIGPLFESVGHGYETTDYKKLDSRLGTNEDLADFVKQCHDNGIRVILDGVFNHTGRDFFAFADIRKNREASPYKDWYCNVNFWGNNEYNDGFSYDNWGGFNLLAKLNQRNPAVKDYICDVIRFWVETFDIDGLRLDAADVLDFDFMKELRYTADQVKEDFWLMGEVIHGDYSRWANDATLHSVTNYTLHKGLYSGHNDHNYFEIAHTVTRTNGMTGNIRLYNFVDNHDVERIATKLNVKAHFEPVHILLYTLPGIPSVYYGSEFAIEGKKERQSDASLRPKIDLGEHKTDYEDNPATKLIMALGKIHKEQSDLVWGDYRQLALTNRQFAFARGGVIVAVNNDDHEAEISVDASEASYVGLLRGELVKAQDGRLAITLQPNSGEIFAPGKKSGKKIILDPPKAKIKTEKPAEAKVLDQPQDTAEDKGRTKAAAPEESGKAASVERTEAGRAANPAGRTKSGTSEESGEAAEPRTAGPREPKEPVKVPDIPYEEMTVEELQAAILAKLAKNGPVTDQMKRDVEANIWQNSLLNWVKSFR